MTETHPEKCLIGYARVSTYGQTLDAQLEQLRAAGCSSRNIYREKVTSARADRRELLRLLDRLAPGDVVTVTRWPTTISASPKSHTASVGTVAKLGVRRPPPLAGVGCWPAGISARNRCRACRYRGRSGPGAADRPRTGTSASATPWPYGGSPGSWPCPRSAPCRPAARPGAVRRNRPDGRSGSVNSGPPRLAPAAACERARSRSRARVRECDRC